ncbi:DUF6193 family natural product biosynthesis protein [Streptomyces sp. NBC_01537]|uniref:DUF6193 family natural product biosynthesis protein n=1 Tax=Streptomyces sp. NBC_01537 TaxID=2903896 RepID=UPI003867254E
MSATPRIWRRSPQSRGRGTTGFGEWQGLRTGASAQERPGYAYRALVEAAYGEPALRGLYPFTSHWALRFSTTTRPGLSIVGPCLLAHDVDRSTVSEGFTGSGLIAQATTAQEAVAAAVRLGITPTMVRALTAVRGATGRSRCAARR